MFKYSNMPHYTEYYKVCKRIQARIRCGNCVGTLAGSRMLVNTTNFVKKSEIQTSLNLLHHQIILFFLLHMKYILNLLCCHSKGLKIYGLLSNLSYKIIKTNRIWQQEYRRTLGCSAIMFSKSGKDECISRTTGYRCSSIIVLSDTVGCNATAQQY